MTATTMEEVLKDVDRSRRGQTRMMHEVNGYKIQLRRSLPRHRIRAKDGENIVWVETLDVVNIGYEKFMSFECDVKEIPKNGAEFIWNALEEYCREKKNALRIECILHPEWFHHLIEKKGYLREFCPADILESMPAVVHDTFSAHAIKTFDTTAIYNSISN